MPSDIPADRTKQSSVNTHGTPIAVVNHAKIVDSDEIYGARQACIYDDWVVIHFGEDNIYDGTHVVPRDKIEAITTEYDS